MMNDRLVSDLNINTRAKNALKNEGIYYLSELLQKDEEFFLRMSGAGRMTFISIRDGLAEIGIAWDMADCLTDEKYRLASERCRRTGGNKL